MESDHCQIPPRWPGTPRLPTLWAAATVRWEEIAPIRETQGQGHGGVPKPTTPALLGGTGPPCKKKRAAQECCGAQEPSHCSPAVGWVARQVFQPPARLETHHWASFHKDDTSRTLCDGLSAMQNVASSGLQHVYSLDRSTGTVLNTGPHRTDVFRSKRRTSTKR